MEAIEAILTRRSVREFAAEPVPAEKIETLLRAAMQAPTAHNSQGWEFALVTDQVALARLSEMSQYSGMIGKASAAIIPCARADNKYGIAELGAAAENVLLAAHALGLAAVWVAVYPDEGRISAVRAALAIPAEIVPLCAIPVGMPAARQQPQDRFDKGKIHENRW